jgi:hypothetical protein
VRKNGLDSAKRIEKLFESLHKLKKPRKAISAECRLTNYHILLERVCVWEFRQNYFGLVKSFVTGDIRVIIFYLRK